jgi:OOP family OmpA-OmpF porin
MKSKIWARCFLLFIMLFGFRAAVPAEMDEESLELSLFAGGFFSGDRFMGDNPGTGLRVTYNFTEMFGMEGSLGFIPISSLTIFDGFTYVRLDSRAIFYNADAVVHLYNSRVVPFAAGGVGGMTFRFSETSSNPYGWWGRSRSDTFLAVNFGGGVKVFMTDNIGLRFDVRGYRIFTDGDLDRSDHGSDRDFGGDDINLMEVGGAITFIF